MAWSIPAIDGLHRSPGGGVESASAACGGCERSDFIRRVGTRACRSLGRGVQVVASSGRPVGWTWSGGCGSHGQRAPRDAGIPRGLHEVLGRARVSCSPGDRMESDDAAFAGVAGRAVARGRSDDFRYGRACADGGSGARDRGFRRSRASSSLPGAEPALAADGAEHCHSGDSASGGPQAGLGEEGSATAGRPTAWHGR